MFTKREVAEMITRQYECPGKVRENLICKWLNKSDEEIMNAFLKSCGSQLIKSVNLYFIK